MPARPTARLVQSTIVVPSAAFVKTYASDELFEEALSLSLEAVQASSRATILRVPAVIGWDRAARTVTFERLRGWWTVNHLIRGLSFRGLPSGSLEDLFTRVGYALAEYHAITGHIHGDFDTENVLIDPSQLEVAFIDFSRPDFAFYPAYNRHCVERDLALFLIFLRTKYPPWKAAHLLRRANRLLSRRFLAGYRERLGDESINGARLRGEYEILLSQPYLSRTFAVRFLRRSAIFGLEDIPV